MLPPLLLSVRVPTLLARAWRALLPDKPRSATPRRGRLHIIIFRLDAMGDVVMTTPLFRELKRSYPNSHCTAVVRHDFRPLLVTNAFLDEILTLPEIRAHWIPRSAKNLLAALLFYWRRLRQRSFNIAISPRWDVDEHLTTLLCLLTNATQRVGYTEKTSPRKQQLNRGFDAAFTLPLPAGPVQHEVRRNLAVVEALGGNVHDSKLEVRLTERDREAAPRGYWPTCTCFQQADRSGHWRQLPGPVLAARPLCRHGVTIGPTSPPPACHPLLGGERKQALGLATLLNSYENSPCEIVMDEEILDLPQLQPPRAESGLARA